MGDRVMKWCRLLRRKRPLSGGDQQGFTLIEVLIAMGVFAFGIMMVTVMVVRGFDNFTRARTTTAEVYRSVRTIDTFRFALYSNAQIFNTNADQPASYPFGDDQPDFQCWDFNDVVVQGVKFIAVEDQELPSPSASGSYRLFYTKAGKQQVN
jgi:prepilin-type N-terminal cleavage/methylation domain-containing protein